MDGRLRKRMSREQRREQLLSVAASIVEESGTNALTLVSLAQKAQVAKPVVYSHFKSRPELLSSLYEQYDALAIRAIRAAVSSEKLSLVETANVVAESYINAYCAYGAEYEEVGASLMAYPEHSDLLSRMQRYFVSAFADIFQSYLDSSTPRNQIYLAMVFGMIDQAARAVGRGDAPREIALDAMTTSIVSLVQMAQATPTIDP